MRPVGRGTWACVETHPLLNAVGNGRGGNGCVYVWECLPPVTVRQDAGVGGMWKGVRSSIHGEGWETYGCGKPFPARVLLATGRRGGGRVVEGGSASLRWLYARGRVCVCACGKAFVAPPTGREGRRMCVWELLLPVAVRQDRRGRWTCKRIRGSPHWGGGGYGMCVWERFPPVAVR